MKKTLTTNNGKNVTFWMPENSKVIMACEGNDTNIEESRKVGWHNFDDECGFEICDYYDEYQINVAASSLHEAFDAFCKAFVSQLNIREVKRAELVKRLAEAIEAYKRVSLVESNGDIIKNICKLVGKASDDADF